jgi:hypothetical protein
LFGSGDLLRLVGDGQIGSPPLSSSPDLHPFFPGAPSPAAGVVAAASQAGTVDGPVAAAGLAGGAPPLAAAAGRGRAGPPPDEV